MPVQRRGLTEFFTGRTLPWGRSLSTTVLSDLFKALFSSGRRGLDDSGWRQSLWRTYCRDKNRRPLAWRLRGRWCPTTVKMPSLMTPRRIFHCKRMDIFLRPYGWRSWLFVVNWHIPDVYEFSGPVFKPGNWHSRICMSFTAVQVVVSFTFQN
jgi:hypothetical protein